MHFVFVFVYCKNVCIFLGVCIYFYLVLAHLYESIQSVFSVLVFNWVFINVYLSNVMLNFVLMLPNAYKSFFSLALCLCKCFWLLIFNFIKMSLLFPSNNLVITLSVCMCKFFLFVFICFFSLSSVLSFLRLFVSFVCHLFFHFSVCLFLWFVICFFVS